MDEEHGEGIPNCLNAEAFIAARLKELTSLTNEIAKSEKVATIFQRLPKHMRRRAMSHTIKRVPRNLRQSHKNQLMKNNALKKPKKARKRYRKRPKQLLLEYNRRQLTNSWLETHIWHAKRFRMCTKWRYKLAECSYEKTFRATCRATTSHCLVQDISYYCCIELRGHVDTLANTFNLITNPACGLSIRAKCWLAGNREGSVIIYHANYYPYKVVGSVNFMWKPLVDESEIRTLWLWSHPSIHDELVQEFIQVFAFSNVAKNNTYTNIESSVTMVLLRNELNRFRLTGPLSNAVLTKALHPAEGYDETLLKSASDTWWSASRDRIVYRDGSLELLKKYPRPSLFPAHSILGCNIVDPRLFLKQKRLKAVPENEGYDYCLSTPTNLIYSAIWEIDIRNEVTTGKLPLVKLNALRSELLIPGFDEQLLKTVNNVIPILLIQRPGVSIREIRTNYGCGWDIIIPSNWAMPVWLSLILSGARAGGIRETCSINFESQRAPEMWPDSKAGKEYYTDLKSRNEDVYFKKPPKKRTNYLKFAMPTPFYHDWELLSKEWSSFSDGSYFVLRERCLLQQLKEYTEHFTSKCSFDLPNSLPSNALVAVNITMLCKGQLAPFSHICIPSQQDLMKRKQDKCFTGPSEKLHPDILKHERKTLKLKHVKELKRLRRKRTKEKKQRMQLGPPLTITKRKKSPTEAEVQDYLREMRELWIPKVTKLRKFCTREVGGYVITSGFSFLKSCVLGQGYITAEALSKLLAETKRSNSDLVILTRSLNSLNYRFCKINIIV